MKTDSFSSKCFHTPSLSRNATTDYTEQGPEENPLEAPRFFELNKISQSICHFHRFVDTDWRHSSSCCSDCCQNTKITPQIASFVEAEVRRQVKSSLVPHAWLISELYRLLQIYTSCQTNVPSTITDHSKSIVHILLKNN